ncbi:MAG: hypothetical protein KC776_16555 [Myxococcales bacterium]|nr:hypothetical protein [Myxococcales bacterium]MCB9580186.1 hypothetical protein [Polyangiaceae bacterium]
MTSSTEGSAVSEHEVSDRFHVAAHEYGSLLRLRTPGTYAMDVAIALLVFFEAEFDAEVEDTGWKRGHGLSVAVPLRVHLQSLEVDLSTDGDEIVVQRVGGSKQGFEALCAQIFDHELCDGLPPWQG